MVSAIMVTGRHVLLQAFGELPPNHAPFRTHYPSIHPRPNHLRGYTGASGQPEFWFCGLGHCHWNGVKGLKVSAKEVSRWRPTFRTQTRWNRGVYSLQMGENFLNNHWVLDAGNHFRRAAAFPAVFDVDTEYTFQALRPGHGCPLPGGVALPDSNRDVKKN